MGAPSQTKAWIVTQRRLPARGTATGAGQQTLRALKDALLGAGWTCAGSQTASAGGMDGVDRWVTDGDLKWGSSPTDPVMGWIALRLPAAAGPGVHLDTLIHLSATSVGGALSSDLSWYWGFGGAYVGGSSTVRPTYAGGVELVDQVTAPWRDNGSIDFDGVLTTVHSTDGLSQRFFVLAANRVVAFLAIEALAGAPVGWTHPRVVARTAGPPAYTTLTASTRGSLFHEGVWVPTYWAVEGCAGGALNDLVRYANQIVGGPAHEYAISPVGLSCVAPGRAGRYGELVDLYGAPAHLPTGFGLPSGAPATWVKFGDFFFPWDGSAVETT